MTTTVLVVDDQALLRTAFSSLINAEHDMEVAGQAADGREAVEQAQKLAPDVVVMDLRMPGMDGIDVLRTIRRDHPSTKVVVLSACDERSMIDRVRDATLSSPQRRRPGWWQ